MNKRYWLKSGERKEYILASTGNYLQFAISPVLRNIGIDLYTKEVPLTVEYDDKFGDYKSDIYHQIEGDKDQFKKNFIEEWERCRCNQYLAKAEFAPNGLLNFWLSQDMLMQSIKKIIKEGDDR